MIPTLGESGCIVEGIVTTLDAQGAVNLAPMGPIVDNNWEWLVLRPFQGSRTYENLEQRRVGVFHVTDDVRLIAESAVGTPDPLPACVPCASLAGAVLVDACRWYAFRIEKREHAVPRPQWTARVVDRGTAREFLGFNRAKHAVIEAAILATRRGMAAPAAVEAELDRLAPLVEKTGSAKDRQAFQLLRAYLSAPLP